MEYFNNFMITLVLILSHCTQQRQKPPSPYNSAFPVEVPAKLLSAYLLDYPTLTQVNTNRLFIVSGRKHQHELLLELFRHLGKTVTSWAELGNH